MEVYEIKIALKRKCLLVMGFGTSELRNACFLQYQLTCTNVQNLCYFIFLLLKRKCPQKFVIAALA